MFRLSLLIATLMAASLNAANVRYELINEPAKQDGKELSGHITVETSGSAVPARGFIGNEHILDWHIECDGQTISMATANRETKGVSMLNQGYGNFLVATTDGLYLQGYGEHPSGSWIEFENVTGGVGPYTETTKFKLQTRSIQSEEVISGRRVPVWEDMIERYFSSGKYPKWNRSFHSITIAPKMPLTYSNYVRIGENPTLVEDVKPQPPKPTPVDPKPVVPGPEPSTDEFYQVYARINELEREIVKLKNRIQNLEQ